MSSAVLLLLTVVSLLAGATTAAGPFDYELCKERLCLVNKECGTFDEYKTLEAYSGEKACKILLAIRPYSEKKWRVTVQANIATNKIHLQIADQNSTVKSNLASCGVNSNGEIEAKANAPSYSAVLLSSSSQADSFFCDFFFITVSHTLMPLADRMDYLELRYGTKVDDISRLHHRSFDVVFTPYEGICDPDQIKFYQSAANPDQRLAHVNADHFALTCPDGYDLMYYDGPVARKVSMIKCVSNGAPEPWDVRYNYHITPPYGVGKVTVIPRDRDLYAFCAAPPLCSAQ